MGTPNSPLSNRLMSNILVVGTIFATIYVFLSLTILEYNSVKVWVSVFSVGLFGELTLLVRNEKWLEISRGIFTFTTPIIMVCSWLYFDGATGSAGYFSVSMSVVLGVILSAKWRILSLLLPVAGVLILAIIQYLHPEWIRHEGT